MRRLPTTARRWSFPFITARRRSSPFTTALLAAGLTTAAGGALARPSDYIFSPIVEQGELEIDSKAGVAHDREGSTYWSGSIGVEYGLTDFWSAELTLNVGRRPGESSGVDSLEWENRFQFTPHDDRPYVIGGLLEIERARHRDEGWEFRFGPLLQFHAGPRQFNLNLLFERQADAREKEPTQFGYQWQFRPQREAAFDVGLQGFGELGRWDHWSPRREQSHILGPTIFATLGDDDDPAIEVGWMFGTGGAAPRHTLRLQAMIPF